MFKLVIAVDGSEFSDRAILAAARLTRAGPEVEAVIVNVRDDPRALGSDDRESLERFDKDQRRRQDAVLLAADKLARSAGLKVVLRAAMGLPASEIVRAAEDTKADALAMGVRGMGPSGGPLIGPVTHRVLHQATVPVFLSKQREPAMVTHGLLVRLEALAGREDELEAFLRNAQTLVRAEPGTTAWFAADRAGRG